MSLPISGFMPIPLAIMPPFMAYQSLVMGDAFGRAFQFGKRKISAMSNEEFNKLDIVTMFESISNEYTRMIPSVEKAMAQSTELQVSIVKELLRIIPELGKALVGGIQDVAVGTAFEHPLHGHLFGHGATETRPSDPTIPAPTGPTRPSPTVTPQPSGSPAGTELYHGKTASQMTVLIGQTKSNLTIMTAQRDVIALAYQKAVNYRNQVQQKIRVGNSTAINSVWKQRNDALNVIGLKLGKINTNRLHLQNQLKLMELYKSWKLSNYNGR